MTHRDTILIENKKFPISLIKNLERSGLTIIRSGAIPDRCLANRTLAYVIGFDVSTIKHPLRAAILKNRLAHLGVPVFSWNRDAPYHNNIPDYRLSIFSYLRPIDIYATHSLVDTRWTFADTVIYLPNAVDSDKYNLRDEVHTAFTKLRNKKQYAVDVSFFGTLLNEHPYKEVVSRQNFFRQLGNALSCQGISYQFIDTAHTRMTIDEQISLIQSSRININFGAYCDYSTNVSFPPGGLPERCFGIPACGGFLLTDKRTHTNDCFEVGTHLDEFETVDECIAKIGYYLGNFEKSREIAEAGYIHVMRHHTYANRAASLHKILQNWHLARDS